MAALETLHWKRKKGFSPRFPKQREREALKHGRRGSRGRNCWNSRAENLLGHFFPRSTIMRAGRLICIFPGLKPAPAGRQLPWNPALHPSQFFLTQFLGGVTDIALVQGWRILEIKNEIIAIFKGKGKSPQADGPFVSVPGTFKLLPRENLSQENWPREKEREW